MTKDPALNRCVESHMYGCTYYTVLLLAILDQEEQEDQEKSAAGAASHLLCRALHLPRSRLAKRKEEKSRSPEGTLDINSSYII